MSRIIRSGFVRVGPLTPPPNKRPMWAIEWHPVVAGNPEATPECSAIHDFDWIVYRVNYPADFDGGVPL